MAAKKTTKSLKLPAKPVKDRAVEAALSLSARMGWEMITLTDIADETGISLAELSDLFEDKTDILVAYGRMLDKKMLEACADPDPSTPDKERLFDVLMERLELINQNRAAVISVLKSFTLDPKQAVISLPHLCRSMTWSLEAAGIETTGFKGAVRVAGITAVYLNVLRSWMKDDAPDLGKTMAALDRNLDRAGQCANTFML